MSRHRGNTGTILIVLTFVLSLLGMTAPAMGVAAPSKSVPAATPIVHTFATVSVPRVATKPAVRVVHSVAPVRHPAAKSYKVRRGDCLTGIGTKVHARWTRIWRANLHRIGHNPNYIRAGWRLAIPGAKAKLPSWSAAHASIRSAHRSHAAIHRGGSRRQNAVARAIAYARNAVRRHAMYVWAASGPNAYDCSGLTMMAYRQSGIHLAHFAATQYAQTPHVSRGSLRPGDLLFFYAGIGHVGLYIGHGRMIEAYNAGYPLRITTLGSWQWGSFQGASRPANLLPA